MTTNNETKAAATVAGNKKGSPTLKIELTFEELLASRWNASYGLPLDPDYLKDLAADIKRNELLHPVTLIKNKTGPGYHILAGVKRVAALKLLRGEKSGLANGEYRVRNDLDEGNPQCFDVSAAENQVRRNASPYEMARYVRRLIEEEGVDQGHVSKTLKLPRATVNRLSKLDEYFPKLPESWQKNLKYSHGPGMQEFKPAITFSHWYEVAGVIKEVNVISEIREFLDKAHDEEWSTRELKSQLSELDLAQGKPVSSNPADGAGTTDKPATAKKDPKIDPISKANSAYKGVGKVLNLLKDIDGVEQAVQLLQEAAELIGQRLGLLNEEKEARKAERAKSKAKGPKTKAKEGTEE